MGRVRALSGAGSRTACVFALVLLLTSCARIPFEPIAYPSVAALDPTAVRLEFARSLPEQFVVFNSIVFRYRFQTISALGFTRGETVAGTFAVVGLTPTGLKLFEITGTDDGFETLYAQAELLELGDFPEAVATDIRRIYFNRVPSTRAAVNEKSDRIVFSDHVDGGTLDYIFAGPEGLLAEKRFYEGRKRAWTVSYYEYRRVGGKLYPGGIILKHHKYGYQLTVRLRGIRS